MGKIKALNKVLKNIALNRGKVINAVIESRKVDTGLINKARKFIAYDKKGKFLGSLDASFTKGERVWINDVNIREKFQGKGLATQLFNHVARMAKRTNKRFLWTESHILDKSMIKIRSKYPSKHIAMGLGTYGEQSALVSENMAKKYISNQKAYIKSVSDIKNIKFIRKNGRIIPIRIRR